MIGPRLSAAAGVFPSAAALQQPHVGPTDSVLVESPLPGGVAEIARFLLNTVPPWMQAGGVIIGVAVGVFVLRALVLHRLALRDWVVSRPRNIRWALAAAGIVLVVAGGSIGASTWNYTQHSNDFCTGCHVMNPAFQKFTNDENKHVDLSCHACHQQSPFASMRQLYHWVAERPEKITAHAKVPNQVCEGCHVTADTAVWQRVAATAGHRVHFESDSSTLKDLQCVTCHGLEVHRFRPVKETCGQSECHEPHDTEIVLGKMATQTVRHCTSCHPFTADVPALATRDSARGTLVPGETQCLGCHEMKAVLTDFAERKDPHGGKCGTCHNPHLQKTPQEATSCAASGCHTTWDDTPFHMGDSHRRVVEQCRTCHIPHRSEVDASDCSGCHLRVRESGKLRPPVPFDTTRALRRSLMTGTGRGDAIDPDAVDAAPIDSFPHARHTTVACLECHQTGTGHGRLTFEAPRGCAICHHQDPTPTRCASCHRTEAYGTVKQATVTVTVPGQAPSPRPVEFLHAKHVTRTCVECHTTPVTLALAPPQAQCEGCHTEHHDEGRTCSACHTIADPKREHRSPEAAHQRCDACHRATTIAKLTPTRSFCGTCHATQVKDHYDAKECTTCHFLAEPVAQRSRLLSPPPR